MQNMRMMPNGSMASMAPNEMARMAMQQNMQNRQNPYVPVMFRPNNVDGGLMTSFSRATQQQLAMMKNQQMMHQMQRDGSDVDINGQQRPQSPSPADNAPSPKRPRLEGGPMNGQQVLPNGRGQPQGIPNQQVGNAPNVPAASAATQVLMASGINPNNLTPEQFQNFQNQAPAIQARSIQVYAQNMAHHQRSAMNNQVTKGIPNTAGGPTQGSPMMPPGSEAGMPDFYNTANGGPNAMRGIQGPGAQGANGGNHALHDYQMQLMLLEQQNKKRLMMARQEQDNMNLPRTDGAGGPAAQANFQGMSPQGARSGPSPNPNDQMKRATPKLNQTGLPASPLPDGQTRGSPASMAFNAGMDPNNMAPQFYTGMKMGDGMGAPQSGPMMRPPSSHPTGFNGPVNPQMENFRQGQNAGRMPGQTPGWQAQPNQAPMMTQQQQPANQQPPQMGTPQQRNAMPPPQAPPAGTANNGRTQPSSPQQAAAPPTPSQTNKANPKAKKDKERKVSSCKL
jgi:hypothetical protein